ncbi:hypothetical protein [Nonomuraea sp. NPDC050786]|uniref:hypothetical protein n=1 Tax=Nonomuraea sp. NPDC050786 TaxID=3154840 RepID=UPI0033D5EF2A
MSSEFSGDRERALQAAAMASAAAVILFEYPLARNIALMVGTLVSNPDGMAEAAAAWKAPAEGADGLNFETIKQEMVKLKEQIEEKGHWKGPAWQVFSEAADTFIEQLDAAKRYHQSVGAGMHGVGNVYHWAVQVGMLVAAAMMGVALAKLSMFVLNVAVAMTVRGVINGILVSLGQVLRGLVGKQVKTVAVMTGILLTVNGLCASLSQLFDKNRPKADFSPADLEYAAPKDKSGVGTLQPKNNGMPNLNTSMPSMGFF